MSESFARAKSRWRGRSHHPICISFCTCIYTRPNDIRRGTNLWLILTDKKMETILLIKLMETILWKIICKRGALLDL